VGRWQHDVSVAGDVMSILVTGGHGFLGKHVTTALRKAGHAFVMLAGPRHGGITDVRDAASFLEAVEAVKPSAIIHLAATCGGIEANRQCPGTFFRDNMQMGISVLEAARQACVSRVVMIGTVCSYPKHCPTPFREADLWNGYPEETNAPYGVAKRALFTMAEAYRAEFGVDSICLLPANLYGPGDNFDPQTSHVIPAMIRKFTEAKKVGTAPVTLWGTGDPTREFLYVEDAADAIVRAVTCGAVEGPINLGTGCETRIRDLAERIAHMVGYEGPIAWDSSKPDGQPRRSLDTSRARSTLGWKAETMIELGLRKTIEWYGARA
jgi:nucleoside-diphosphate-sugar epimerase